MKTHKLYLTEKEISQMTGYSRAYFQRARWAGKPEIPYLKLPGSSKILYPVKEVTEFFSQHPLRTSTSQFEKGV